MQSLISLFKSILRSVSLAQQVDQNTNLASRDSTLIQKEQMPLARDTDLANRICAFRAKAHMRVAGFVFGLPVC